jgi:hypothetical protein
LEEVAYKAVQAVNGAVTWKAAMAAQSAAMKAVGAARVAWEAMRIGDPDTVGAAEMALRWRDAARDAR